MPKLDLNMEYLNLFILRHGESKAQTGEDKGADTHLSALGRMQARRAGIGLRGIPFDRVVCSTLLRARETLAGLSLDPVIPVAYDERLVECDVLPGDDPVRRARILTEDLAREAETQKTHHLLFVCHAYLASLLCATLAGGPEIDGNMYIRLSNAHLGLIRIPRSPDAIKLLIGWNLDSLSAASFVHTVFP